MTLAEAQRKLDLWSAAEDAVATGQSYSIGSRSLTRADGRFIAERLAHYEALVASLKAGQGGGARVFQAIPRDL